MPGNRFEFLEARAALDAVEAGERDADRASVTARSTCWPSMSWPSRAPRPSARRITFRRNPRRTAYRWIDAALFARLLGFVRDGGYALKAMTTSATAPDEQGGWRIAHPRLAAQHRLNARIIVDALTLDVRFKNRRRLGSVEEYFASTLTAGDTFAFAGLSLEVETIRDTDLIVRATTRPARIPSMSGRGWRCRRGSPTRCAPSWPIRRAGGAGRGGGGDVRFWLEMQTLRSVLPRPGELR